MLSGKGGSPIGTNHSMSRSHQPTPSPGAARQPCNAKPASTVPAYTHSGSSSRRERLLSTEAAGRSSERAINDPARANITPSDGKTTVNQTALKNVCNVMMRSSAIARNRSR